MVLSVIFNTEQFLFYLYALRILLDNKFNDKRYEEHEEHDIKHIAYQTRTDFYRISGSEMVAQNAGNGAGNRKRVYNGSGRCKGCDCAEIARDIERLGCAGRFH